MERNFCCGLIEKLKQNILNQHQELIQITQKQNLRHMIVYGHIYVMLVTLFVYHMIESIAALLTTFNPMVLLAR